MINIMIRIKILAVAQVLTKQERAAFLLPDTYQTQSAETGIESLGALHSDGQRSEKMAGYVS